MNFASKLAWLLIVPLLVSCTHYLYQGRLRAPDSQNIQREHVLYWTKTDPWLGQVKGGPASLLSECGAYIGFDETADGILFRGSPASDVRVIGGEEQPSADCGRFINLHSFAEDPPAELQLNIKCEPLSDEFSLRQRTYLQAQVSPYSFPIREHKQWSFWGETLEAPEPPICADLAADP